MSKKDLAKASILILTVVLILTALVLEARMLIYWVKATSGKVSWEVFGGTFSLFLYANVISIPFKWISESILKKDAKK